MAGPTQSTRQLAVNTPLGADKLLLVGFSGREAISQLFVFHLDMVAENATAVPFDQLIGQGISLRLNMAGGQKRFFHGLCSRVSQGGRDTEFTQYRMEVVPAFWLLTRNAQSRIFQQKSVPDILKVVLAGFDVEYLLQGTFQPRNYCVQYRETDFNFACRIMEEEGIYYYFKHTEAGHRLVLANTPDAHIDVPGAADLIFEPISGGNRPENRIHSWEKFQELRAGKVTLWDHHGQLAHKHLEAVKTIQETVQAGTVAHKLKLGANGDLELFDWPGGYAERFDGVDPGGGDRAADLQKIFDDNGRTAGIRMQEEALASLSIEGQSDCQQLTSGHKFKLTRHFNADGPYVITAVQHSAAQGAEFRSSNQPPLLYSNRFTCIPLALPFRPIRRTPKPVAGAQTAVVVVPSGEEIFPDKFGRVKVQFHWDRDGKHDLNSSCWVRVGQLFAGKRWGAMFTPRAGHEVIVDFLEGDPDQPVIVGSLYNSENLPHYELPKFKTLSGIKTNSSPGSDGFNEIRFEDKKGKEQLFLHSQKRMDVRAKGCFFDTSGGDRHTVIGMRSDDKPGGNYTISVGGDHDQHVKGNHYENVDKDFNQVVKGKTVFDYQTDHDLFVKGKSQYNAQEIVIEAKTKITLKVGGSFVVVDASGVSIMGPMVKINSGGAPTPAVPGLVQDCADAAPADTGEPGDIDKITGVEAPTIVRKPRVVPSQHGFTVVRNPDGTLQVGKNITIKGSPEYQAAVLDDLAKLNSTPTGEKLLKKLDESKHPVIIEPVPPGGPQNNALANPTNPADDVAGKAQPNADGTPGTGAGTTVQYNPSLTSEYTGEDGKTHTMEPHETLGHELIHAQHQGAGEDLIAQPDPLDPGDNLEEARTIGVHGFENEEISERKIHEEAGESPRPNHNSITKSTFQDENGVWHEESTDAAGNTTSKVIPAPANARPNH